MAGNALVLFVGMSLAVVVRRTNYSIPGSLFAKCGLQRCLHDGQLLQARRSIGQYWGFRPCEFLGL